LAQLQLAEAGTPIAEISFDKGLTKVEISFDKMLPLVFDFIQQRYFWFLRF
jgi:hypothetical protein